MGSDPLRPSNKRALLFYTISALYAVFVLWLYYPALLLYFDTDDWVFIKFARDIPWQEPWRYLTPKTIWYYRPLQVLQFGITYQLVGLNEFWYNLQSLIMIFISWGLFYWLINEVFGRRVALLALIFLSVSPTAPDVLTWKSNFNTIHHAIVTLLAGVCFTRYLRSASRNWYFAAITVAVAGWFTKESIVNLPFILLTLWVTCYLQYKWEGRTWLRIKAGLFGARRQWPYRAIFWDLLPFAVLTIIYVGLHWWLFENADPNMAATNSLSTPLGAIRNFISMTSYGLFYFLYDPLIIYQSPVIGQATQFIVRKSMVLPIIAIILAWRTRNVTMLFSVAFVAMTFIPVFLLEMHWMARYYYLAAAGAAVFLAALIFMISGSALAGISTLRSMNHISARQRLRLYLGLVFFVWVFVSSIIRFQQHIGQKGLEADFVRQTFVYLQSEGKTLPSGSVIVFDRTPSTYMVTGIGTREMTTLATGRMDLLGFNRHVYRKYEDKLDATRWPHLYTLDVLTTQPLLKKQEHTTTATNAREPEPATSQR